MEIGNLSNNQALLELYGDRKYDDVESLKNLSGDDQMEREEKMKVLGEQFENLFLNMVMSEMRKTEMSAGLFGKGLGEDIYKQMLDKEYVTEMTKSIDLGFSDAMLRNLEPEK